MTDLSVLMSTFKLTASIHLFCGQSSGLSVLERAQVRDVLQWATPVKVGFVYPSWHFFIPFSPRWKSQCGVYNCRLNQVSLLCTWQLPYEITASGDIHVWREWSSAQVQSLGPFQHAATFGSQTQAGLLVHGRVCSQMQVNWYRFLLCFRKRN